jgi:hypothetical protein
LVGVIRRKKQVKFRKPFPDVLSRTLLYSLAFAALSATSLKADLVVSGTTDIWLAGQPNGASVTGSFGTDTAPDNSPVGVGVFSGEALNFAITGYIPVSVAGPGCLDTDADASSSCFPDEWGFSSGPANGISLAHLPADALVGVFVGAGGPSGAAPPDLDFTGPGGMSFLTLSPELDQLFFIGDGLTGTGTGSVQQFFAPTGATELYLAVADSVGSSVGNSGSITVQVTPEPGYYGVLAASFGGLMFVLLRRSRA